MKKNIGAALALYPSPIIVVGAMAGGKPTWTLAAHAGIMAHSHLMVSLLQAHYINKGIRENKILSVNVVDESWLKDADRMGVVSGNREDKSGAFAYTVGENGAPLIDAAKVSMECAASDISASAARPGCPPWAAGADEGRPAPDAWVEGALVCGFWGSDTTRLLRQGTGMIPSAYDVSSLRRQATHFEGEPQTA